MRQVRSREVRVVSATTERSSPFSSSLLFDYIAQYMYEGDAPLGERRARALAPDRALRAELLGAEELRELLSPDVIAAMELELQGLIDDRRPRDVDEAADVLRRLGDLRADEAAARGITAEWLAVLARGQRAVPVLVGGEERWIAAGEAGRYRDALGVELPAGIPEVFLGVTTDAIETLLLRWARTHVPFLAADPAARWGLPGQLVDRILTALTARGRLLSGEFHPGGTEREYCHPEVLVALRRRSLAALRHEIEGAPVEVIGRFLPAWQGVGVEARGLERLAEVVHQLQGCALPLSVIERDVLPARVSGYTPSLLDHLVSIGEVVWAGRGALGASDGRVALYLRTDASRLLPAAVEKVEGEVHEAIRGHMQARGASFFADLLRAVGGATAAVVLQALWDLVWAGEVTKDTFLPLGSFAAAARRAR